MGRHFQDNEINKAILSKQISGAEKRRTPKIMSKIPVFDSDGPSRDAINIRLGQLVGFELQIKPGEAENKHNIHWEDIF